MSQIEPLQAALDQLLLALDIVHRKRFVRSDHRWPARTYCNNKSYYLRKTPSLMKMHNIEGAKMTRDPIAHGQAEAPAPRISTWKRQHLKTSHSYALGRQSPLSGPRRVARGRANPEYKRVPHSGLLCSNAYSYGGF